MNNNYLKEQLSKLNENTTLKDLQKYVNDMIEIRGFSQETPQDVMLLLTEEVGELAKEIRKSRKYYLDTNKNNELDVEGEIADAKHIEAVSKLPSKEELIGMLLSVWTAPARYFVTGLDNLRKQKEGE